MMNNQQNSTSSITSSAPPPPTSTLLSSQQSTTLHHTNTITTTNNNINNDDNWDLVVPTSLTIQNPTQNHQQSSPTSSSTNNNSTSSNNQGADGGVHTRRHHDTYYMHGLNSSLLSGSTAMNTAAGAGNQFGQSTTGSSGKNLNHLPTQQTDLLLPTKPPLLPQKTWRRVHFNSSTEPCPRSGAASVIHGTSLLVYGGYGGQCRLDDLWAFDFNERGWKQIIYDGCGPGPRENNGMVQIGNFLYLFGGYSGFQWLDDLHEFDLIQKKWRLVEPRGQAPTSRFGYMSASYQDKTRSELILFAGYDGTTWNNTMCVYSFTTGEWSTRQQYGEIPRARSCPGWARVGNVVYLFGGYDGTTRMNDFFVLDLKTTTWTVVRHRFGTPPSERYFHSMVYHKRKLYVYGGYSGTVRLCDLHSFDLDTLTWEEIIMPGDVPGGRSSLVMQVYNNALWVLGGYNGHDVLNDLYTINIDDVEIPTSTLMTDMERLLNDELLSDVTFRVEGINIPAVSSLVAIRSEHFRAMLFGGMKEDLVIKSHKNEPIVIGDMKAQTFRLVMRYLYVDGIPDRLNMEDLLLLLIAAERFLLDRLRMLCISSIQSQISIFNVIETLLTAHLYNVNELKDLCLEFIVLNMEAVKRVSNFGDLKKEPDLLLEILMLQTR
jgi:N-acetylneuraminic acid mutarotase